MRNILVLAMVIFSINSVHANENDRYGGLSYEEYQKRRLVLEGIFQKQIESSLPQTLDCLNPQNESTVQLKVGDLLEKALKKKSLRERFFYSDSDLLQKRIREHNNSWAHVFAEDLVRGGFGVKSVVIELPAEDNFFLQGVVETPTSDQMKLQCVYRPESKEATNIN